MSVLRSMLVVGLVTLSLMSGSAAGAPGRTPSPGSGKVQVVEVSTPTRADKARLQGLNLDLTEHGDQDSLEVVLYGEADARLLRDAGFSYTVRIADLAARDEENRRADAQYAAATAVSPLPSGRDSYRYLIDYET